VELFDFSLTDQIFAPGHTFKVKEVRKILDNLSHYDFDEFKEEGYIEYFRNLRVKIEEQQLNVPTPDISKQKKMDKVFGIKFFDFSLTEKIFVPYLEKYFNHELPEIIVFAAKETNPFYVV